MTTFEDWEFKIITRPDSDIQKILNTWKHTYKLYIISVSFTETSTTILLARRAL